MPERDIIVVGGSAGSISALSAIVGGLPEDLAATIFAIVHVPASAVSRLPALLSRAGPLPAAHAQHGEAIKPRRIYVAPPDRHLLVRRGRIELSRGPRENHARPAIDPLFRSAARAFGPRVIGIVLSGALYDGSVGLMAVTMRGGVAIVQDPREAAFDSMPRSALRMVSADYVLPVADIPAVLASLVGEPVNEEGMLPMVDDEERIEAVVTADFLEQASDQRAEETTVYTCPECGGVLWQLENGPTARFRCHVGHAYAPEVLLSDKSEELEAALWKSLRLLKEKATLSRQMATRTLEHENGGRARKMARRIEEQAELDERYARSIEELLAAMPSSLDQAPVVTDSLGAAQAND